MTQFDTVEKLRNSRIQHGPMNRRIYLMKLGKGDAPAILGDLEALARARDYTKVFAKVPDSAVGPFLEAGYVREAHIPGFHRGEEGATFLGRFLSEARGTEAFPGEVAENLRLAEAKAGQSEGVPIPDGIDIFETAPGDAPAMAEVYRAVFETYPFPIHEPDYLVETMRTHVRYFGVRDGGCLTALASSEMDREGLNVEMTDFATLPEARGRGLAVWLLRHMEGAMAEEGMITAHTIARALSPGMNITFSKLGYSHGGTLTNNTDICGRIESMNIWHRRLAPQTP